MPSIRTDDAVNLYYEEAGTGTPMLGAPDAPFFAPVSLHHLRRTQGSSGGSIGLPRMASRRRTRRRMFARR